MLRNHEIIDLLLLPCDLAFFYHSINFCRQFSHTDWYVRVVC